MNKVKNKSKQNKISIDMNKKTHTDTTAIRISTDIYESLRKKAFFDRTTIRQVADDILKQHLYEEV